MSSDRSHAWWSVTESVLKVLVIPLGLAIGAWIVQARMKKEEVRRDYVQLATTILSSRDTGRVGVELRRWAGQVLSQNSPTPVPDELLRELTSGAETLPGAQVAAGVQPIDSLLPASQVVARELMGRLRRAGIRATITKTLVGEVEQERLRKAGFSTHLYGDNPHNFGIAFDVTPDSAGLPYTDPSIYTRICNLAKGLPLDAGISRYKPYVHFELKRPPPVSPRCDVQQD